MSCDEDDGAGLFWGSQLENLGDAVFERVDDILVAWVVKERHRTWGI